MTANFATERRRRRIVLVVALFLGLGAALATYWVASRPQTGPQPTPQVATIVVAAVEIPARTVIVAEMLTTEQVVAGPTYATAITDPQAAVGQVTAVNIAAGEPIRPNLYASGTAGGVTILGPEETIGPDSPIWRAVSVLAPRDRAVGGLIRAGDRIDLFVTLSPQLFDPNGPAFGFTDPQHDPATGSLYSAETTKVLWTNLEVLIADIDNSLYVLRVDELTAEEIAHVQSIGANFTFGLRPAADTRDVDPTDFGQTTNQLIDRYGFPIPVMIEVGGSPAPPPAPTPEPAESPAP